MSDFAPGAAYEVEIPFSMRNRTARVLWGIAYVLLFKPSPRWFHSWRRFLLRLFGAEIGEGSRIYPQVTIWAPWNLRCGEYVGIADGATLYNQATIHLGNRATVSQGAFLCTGTHNYCSKRFELVSKPINVGDFAWVCAEVFIHPGVTIGAGAVVGARSVVNSDVPPWMVCAGFPCTPLKPRQRGD